VRLLQRLGAQRVVGEPIEVAAEREAVLSPDALERADELFRSPVALVVLEPRLADRGELALEPAADDVDRDPAVRDVIDGRELLGDDRRRPRPRQDRREDLEPRGRVEQRLAERDRLVLVLGAVPGSVNRIWVSA
jgi:hypothetical protein